MKKCDVDPQFLNISIGIQICNIINSLFTIFRQTYVGKRAIVNLKVKAETNGYTIRVGNDNYSLTFDEAWNIFVSEAAVQFGNYGQESTSEGMGS